MIREIKHYWCDGHPSDDDIAKAFEIIGESDTIIELNWRKFGYPYSVMISKEDTPSGVKERLPKIYGM